MRLETVRGMGTVPAWRLFFSNLPGPIDYVAVDQEALGTLEGAVGDHVAEDRVTDVERLDEPLDDRVVLDARTRLPVL
jgi:hypothetical protein